MTKENKKVEAFEATLEKSYEWIESYGRELGQSQPQLAYRCLRAGLHAIRDRLPPTEAVALSAQLPMLIRGVYFEGWHPSGKPIRAHSLDEVHAAIARELEGGLGAPPQDVLRASFAVLNAHVGAGEIRKIRHLLPEPVRSAWPEPALGNGHAQPRP